MGELHEDAQWSWFTTSFVRWRHRGRPGRSGREPSVLTVMVVALFVIGTMLALATFVGYLIGLVL